MFFYAKENFDHIEEISIIKAILLDGEVGSWILVKI
jgi:hypothetical protein